jgi:hypothetical protein
MPNKLRPVARSVAPAEIISKPIVIVSINARKYKTIADTINTVPLMS